MHRGCALFLFFVFTVCCNAVTPPIIPRWARVPAPPGRTVDNSAPEQQRVCTVVSAAGCSETGWHCPRGQSCNSVCGDGLLRGWEECDDGNLQRGDGCDDACQIEPGWKCGQPGQKCSTVCGDGAIGSPVEQCDDGNTNSLDGCDANCQWELGRCALQSTSLCAAAGRREELGAKEFVPRGDVPVLRWCTRRECTVEECCRPVPANCTQNFAGSQDCTTQGWAWDDEPAELKVCKGVLEAGCVAGCSSLRCPINWQPKPRSDSIACPQGSGCSLGLCCRSSATSCTCREAHCCAEVLSPPPFIHIESSAEDVFDLAGPISIMTDTGVAAGGKLRWYYALRGGRMTHVDLHRVLNGSQTVLQGYKLTLPNIAQLETLLGNHNAPTSLGENINWHVWSSSLHSAGSYWVWHAANVTTDSQSKYVAPQTEAKHVVLEVAEAFTVTLGSSKLTRIMLREGVQCCFDDDDKTLQGVPSELVGATFFGLTGKHKDHQAGIFTVISEVDAIVYGVAVYDFKHSNGKELASGWPVSEGGYLAQEGWQEVAAVGFQLMPWKFPMGSWRRHLRAGVPLEIPHLQTLYGSVALKPIR